MRNRRLRTVADIASWRLCMGCGGCKWACPNDAIMLRDIEGVGIRPIVAESKCEKCGECVEVCPGIKLEHKPFPDGCINELKSSWGSVLQLWEGYAYDQKIRYAGSSGGMATALALYGLESGIAGVLHIGVDKDIPIKNVPVYSKTKEQLLACTGSRYAPAAPCQAFDIIKEQNSKSIFIGKPCDIATLSKARGFDPELDKKVALTISIFCAGTPAFEGTYNLIEQLGAKPGQIKELRYRGCGWPGKTVVKIKSSNEQEVREMTYEESWGKILSRYTQFRCRLCPDGTGEFADISCGDPWYREIKPGESGRSLVLVRTELGREVLGRAMEAGYVEMERVRPAALAASQKALLNKRQNLFGRLLGMRMMFVPTPRFKGFSLLSNWRQISVRDKYRSVLGTIRRIVTRGWLAPVKSLNVNTTDYTEDASACEIIDDFGENS